MLLLSNLIHVVLSNKDTFGSIPEELYDLSKLTFLQLASSSDMMGTFSTRIGLLTNLNYLGIWTTGHYGTIPSEVGRLSLLEELAFGVQPNLGGTIPNELYDLTRLTRLGLYEASLGLGGFEESESERRIDSRIGVLTNLLALMLDQKNLSGSVPSEVGRLSSTLSLFTVANNSLTGSIPSEIGKLAKLQGRDSGTCKDRVE